MAVEELLEEKTEQVETERSKKYHLTEIKNNREEIREMSEQTLDYAQTIYPKLPDIPDWGVTPMAFIEFMNQAYSFLANKATKNMNEVQVVFGDFFTLSIEFGTTKDAYKDATFNPKIVVGPEMIYDNENPENNKLRTDTPVIELTSDIETIGNGAKNVLKSKYGFIFEDWRDIVYIVASFLRIAKKFMVEHKDTEEWGLKINVAEIADIQIEKYKLDDDTFNYAINMGPGKAFKLPAKSDEKSEDN